MRLILLHLLLTGTLHASAEVAVGTALLGPAPGLRLQPSVTTDGDDYVVTWRDWRSESFERLMATHVTGDGEIVEPMGITLSTGFHGTNRPGQATASNGRTTYTVWLEGENVMGQLVPFGPPQLLSISANRQASPAVAADGDAAMVVWKEDSGIYATRIAADGHSLDGRGIVLSTVSFASDPKVVFDGEQFVVAWRDWGGVAIRFLSRHSGRVQREHLHISRVSSFALAPRLIVWEGSDGRIHAAGIERRTLTAPLAISPEGMLATMPAAASNGSETLVVWSERVRVAELGGIYAWDPHRIRGARMSSASIDTTPLLIGDTNGAEDTFPSVASNGEEWLVAWTGHGGSAAMTARVSRDGAVSEATRLADGYAAVVMWDGTDYAVAFKSWPEHVLHVNAMAVADTRSYGHELAFADGVLAYARVSEEHGGVKRVFIERVTPIPGTGRSLPYR